ncbi:hypothetical protein BGX26_009466 [Mortierella sp. AD094]|nr:hypothetical protein BGX26_009466 [Mortierella sp. AD094]
MIAIIFLGNTGTGKSTLLSLIGGKFESGVKFRGEFTKDLISQRVRIYGKEVVLIDAPGSFEPNNEDLKNNTRKLTNLLNLGYDYRIYFILKASNRGPSDAELAMIANVNKIVQNSRCTMVVYRVIINQILDQEVFDMYKENIAEDNFKTLFSTLDIRNLSFNFIIEGVTLLRYDTKDNLQKRLREIFADEVDASWLARIVYFVGYNLSLYPNEGALALAFIAVSCMLIWGSRSVKQ